jgi:hypothetical protein
MGSSRGTAKEPAEHAPAVANQRRAQRDNTARTFSRKQRGCYSYGVQWSEQHYWLLPGQTRYEQQRGGGRIERRAVQEHKRDEADGHQLRHLCDCCRRMGGMLNSMLLSYSED